MAITTNNQVTQEQLDRCTRIINENTGKAFYMVQSESDETVEYTVRFTPGKGFSCTCPAGKQGFANCKSTCKHCRWAAAHAEALREERHEQSQIEAYVRQGIDRETATRVVYAKGPQFTQAEIKLDQELYQPNAFSLLR